MLTLPFLSVFMCALVEIKSEYPALGCRCVPPSMCKSNTAITTGYGHINTRLSTENCENQEYVCCEQMKFTSAYLPTRSCGTQNRMLLNDEFTDDSGVAQFGEVPWTMAIMRKDYQRKKILFRCSGSLIHPRVVMTAAHCVADETGAHWMVRAGEWNTHSLQEPLPHQNRDVQEVFVHPVFHAATLKNDVALLVLVESVRITDNVRLVCLPPTNLQLEGISCTASGWSKGDITLGKYPTILKRIEVPLVSRSGCLHSLRNAKLGNFFRLHRSFLCAGGEHNRCTCDEDGGSPLVCPIPGHPGRYVQLGIMSWSIGCGEIDTPCVYTNVPYISSWIDKQLRALNFDTQMYKYE